MLRVRRDSSSFDVPAKSSSYVAALLSSSATPLNGLRTSPPLQSGVFCSSLSVSSSNAPESCDSLRCERHELVTSSALSPAAALRRNGFDADCTSGVVGMLSVMALSTSQCDTSIL